MTTITIYDPAMCCSTGICGADVDQTLVTFAADLDWLKSRGVTVRRINLGQEPGEFTAHKEINALMQATGGDDLPAILVNGELVAKARYPSREELAQWSQLNVGDQTAADKATPCCGTSNTNRCC